MIQSKEAEKEALIACAQFMLAAARTAPKTRGIDNVVACVVDDSDTIGRLARAMREISARENRPSLARDALSIEAVFAVLLVGVRANPAGLNCGFCGCRDCEALKAGSGICAFNSIDLGIAVGSAASMADQFHIDNRIMHSIGRAALETGIFSPDVRQALGIPLSATGKNPFFDRK